MATTVAEDAETYDNDFDPIKERKELEWQQN